MAITLNGTTGITLPNGSASAPAATGTDTDTGIVYGTNTVSLATGGTTAVTVDSSQNVGIGTTTPSTKLNVYGSSPSIFLEQNGGVAGNTQLRLNAAGGANTASVRLQDKYIWASTASGTSLNIGNDLTTAQMVLDSSGNLIMASRTGAGNTRQLQVGTTASSGSANAYGVFVGADSTPYGLGVKGLSSSQGMIGFFDSSDATIGSVSKSGSSVAYNTSSDYRLKENIAPMTGALDKVSALKPVTYTWKADGSNGQGFIAHELQAVCPDAVTGEKDAVETYTDEDGNEQTRIKPQGIDTSFLVATLTAAIQEQQAIITDLKARIETLENK